MDQLVKQAKNDNDVCQHAITDGEKPRCRNMFRSVLTIPYTDMQSLLEQMLSMKCCYAPPTVPSTESICSYNAIKADQSATLQAADSSRAEMCCSLYLVF